MKRLPLEAGDPFAHWRSWGEGFVNVNDAGHLEVITNPAAAGKVDLHELVTRLQRRGVRPPVLVRFPQLIDRQMETLQRAFKTATETFDFRGSYTSVYPLKVNSRRATVARICAAGRPHGAGLEVGTKAELCIALSMLRDSTGPIICNGYKDSAYLELAAAAGAAGYNIVVVFERPREYELVAELRAKGLPCPRLGARVKLNASGMGRWEESSGDLSKFGLTASDLLDCTRLLKECKLLDRLRLLHFHLGSQITNIRNFKQALQEALRFYVELKELGVPLDTLDVGGGLGVDYDGSNSSADSSVNYNVQEYANDIIYTTKEVLDRARIAEPRIITEAGRFLVTHHAVLLVDPLEQPKTSRNPDAPGRARPTWTPSTSSTTWWWRSTARTGASICTTPTRRRTRCCRPSPWAFSRSSSAPRRSPPSPASSSWRAVTRATDASTARTRRLSNASPRGCTRSILNLQVASG